MRQIYELHWVVQLLVLGHALTTNEDEVVKVQLVALDVVGAEDGNQALRRLTSRVVTPIRNASLPIT